MKSEEKKDKISQPHDLGYRSLLSYHQLFRQLIEGYIEQDWKIYLDYDKAERVPRSYILPEFEEKEADVIYKVPFTKYRHSIYLYILMEHQSTVDFSIPLRLFFYLNLIWQDLFKNTDKKIRKRKDYRISPLFAIVLYNGSAEWTAATRLRDMVDGGELFGEYLPDFCYALVNINSLSDEELMRKKDALSGIFFMEKHLGDAILKKYWEEIWRNILEEDHLLAKAIFEWLVMNLRQKDMDIHGFDRIGLENKQNIQKGTVMIQEQLDKLEKRGEKRGKIISKREAIIRILKARFQEVDERICQRVNGIEDLEKLDSLIDLATTCSNTKDFENKM